MIIIYIYCFVLNALFLYNDAISEYDFLTFWLVYHVFNNLNSYYDFKGEMGQGRAYDREI